VVPEDTQTRGNREKLQPGAWPWFDSFACDRFLKQVMPVTGRGHLVQATSQLPIHRIQQEFMNVPFMKSLCERGVSHL
jgi:hypothetical protein